MKNTVLKYDNIESYKFIAQEYMSKNFKKILDLPELSDMTWIDYYTLQDDQTIEQVSFEIYDTPDFWDILTLINEMDPLFSMPYNFDVINTETDNMINKYLLNYSGVYKSDTFNRLKAIMLTINEIDNERFRKIKVIKPGKMYDFIKLVNGTL